jgi:general stress protein 26
MARSITTNTTVELAELLDFARSRHRMLLATSRRDARPQISPVSGGVDVQRRIVISTYPARAKTRNVERDPRVSVLVLSDDWNGPWVQVDGDAEVLHRETMRIQDKSLIRITPTRWVRSRLMDSRPTWPRDSVAELL